jgi:hypothetical protein
MKRNFVHKDKAYFTNDPNMTCGLVYGGIDWLNRNYAMYCDWADATLAKVDAFNVEQCMYKCQTTPECTHYTWSLGVCSLKAGIVIKDNVLNMYNTKDNNMVCGYISSGMRSYQIDAEYSNIFKFSCDIPKRNKLDSKLRLWMRLDRHKRLSEHFACSVASVRVHLRFNSLLHSLHMVKTNHYIKMYVFTLIHSRCFII